MMSLRHAPMTSLFVRTASTDRSDRFGRRGSLVCALRLAVATSAAIWFLGAADAGRAEAQERSTPQPPVIELEEDFVIEGHVRKPEAFYFLRRTPFGFVIRTLDEDFLHELVRSVNAEPF